MAAGFLASLSLLLEKKSRRSELALYVLPRALDSLFLTLMQVATPGALWHAVQPALPSPLARLPVLPVIISTLYCYSICVGRLVVNSRHEFYVTRLAFVCVFHILVGAFPSSPA